jgi:hypothetical protein
MTDRTGAKGPEQPQAIVGPITLGRTAATPTFTIPPNTVVGPDALSAALGTSAIALIDAKSTATAVAVNVSCNGMPQTIEISGQGAAGKTISFAAGSTLYAIARTADQLLLLSTNGVTGSYVSFPIGTGTVTATLAI